MGRKNKVKFIAFECRWESKDKNAEPFMEVASLALMVDQPGGWAHSINKLVLRTGLSGLLNFSPRYGVDVQGGYGLPLNGI